LGTQITISATPRIATFVQRLREIDVATARSPGGPLLEEARARLRDRFSVMPRAGYVLGAKGSGRGPCEAELEDALGRAFAGACSKCWRGVSGGWKEIEYELVRDSRDNAYPSATWKT